mmetsp:Transcript_11785/g.35250  ORF Transcript_11785/g.35250 Transcript_11785/m.35250 type:complete len:260 (+) Transcript_11785:464-1243(+)
MPSSISGLLLAKMPCSSCRILSIPPCALVSSDRLFCSSATCDLSCDEREDIWSILVLSFLIVVVLSSCLSVVSPSSLSQYAFSVASCSASSSSFEIMSAMRPLILPKGSWPAREATRCALEMRMASCARAGDLSLRAMSRMSRTASMSLRDESRERASCTKDSWVKPIVSVRVFFAVASALSSSSRLLVCSSKSEAFVMQAWWRSAMALRSSFRSLEVDARSPSAEAFFSVLAAMLCFEPAISFSAYLSSSSMDAFSIS